MNRQFATAKRTKYTDERYENSITKEITFTEDKGGSFFEENSDGSYYYYSYQWNDGTNYHYYRFYANKGSRLDNELIDNGDGTYKAFVYDYYEQIYNDQTGNYEYYYLYRIYDECFVYEEHQNKSQISVKVADNQFKIYIDSSNGFNINGEGSHRYYYRLDRIRTIEGFFEIGDLWSETYSDIKYNSDNTVDKIYSSKSASEESSSYFQNSYDGDELAKVERYTKDGDKWIKEAAYLTFTYNSDGLLETTTEHDEEGTETVIANVDYDQEGNPIEIFKYFGDITYYDYFGYDHDYPINPNTGLRYDYDDVYMEAGLYSVAKLEYDYSMKNFFGNTLDGLFPELYGFNFNNAIKSASISNSNVFGGVEYKDFNDGGYPQTMQFIGNSDYEFEAYVGQLKIEYQKIEE